MKQKLTVADRMNMSLDEIIDSQNTTKNTIPCSYIYDWIIHTDIDGLEYITGYRNNSNNIYETTNIKAKIIMKPVNESENIDKNNLVIVQEDQFIEEFLPEVVCNNANCEVVDKKGNVKGYITNKELQKSLSKS